MSSNYNNSYSHTQAGKLIAADLNVGDTLIRADWNYNNPAITETEWTVAKVLKSRLVLTRTRHDGVLVTVRVLVTNSKSYTYRNGEVETSLEGDGDSWRRSSFYLFTPDEPQLADIRSAIAIAKDQRDAKNAAHRALEVFKSSMSIENAEATIVALQAFIESKKEAI